MPEIASTSYYPSYNTDLNQPLGNSDHYHTYGNSWFCHKCQTWIEGNNYHTCSLKHFTDPSDNQKIIQLLERIINALDKIALTQPQDSHVGKYKRG